jgi:hypothetical protein
MLNILSIISSWVELEYTLGGRSMGSMAGDGGVFGIQNP